MNDGYNGATLEKIKAMNLHGMSRAFTTSLQVGRPQEETPDEFLAALISAEWDDRCNRKQERCVKNARFRYKAMAPADQLCRTAPAVQEPDIASGRLRIH